MNLEDEIAVVAPQIGLPLKVARLVAYGIAGLAVALLLGWVIWKLFFAERAAQQAHDLAAAHATGEVGKAEGEAGANAANIVAGNATKETIIHNTTTDHYHEITRQPGAGDPVSDPVWDAFVRSVCVRESSAGLPDCQRLREDGTAGVAEGGVERTPPAQ